MPRPSPNRADVPAADPIAPPARLRGGAVVRHLRKQIASHRILPGARLREWDVANEFAVPRLVAREALEALVHLDLAEREPNRGIVVRRRDLDEILGLFRIQEVNEGLSAALAARNAAPDTWDDLIALFGAPMQQIVDNRDLDSYVRHYQAYRARVIEAAGLPPLAELLERVNDMTAIFGRRVLLVSDRTRHALLEHRAVLAALRRRDAAAAEELRRATIANVRGAVQRYHAFVM